MRSVSGFVEVSPTHGFGREGCNTALHIAGFTGRLSNHSPGVSFIPSPISLGGHRYYVCWADTAAVSILRTTTVSRFVVLSLRFLVLSYLHGRLVNDCPGFPYRVSVSGRRSEANANETLNRTFPSRIAPTRARFVSWPFL